MNKILNLSIALLFSANVAAITQSEFVERLQSAHPFFTQQGFDQQTSKLDYIATTANQDWMLTGSVDSTNVLNTQSSSSTIGATHNLVNTGADITISNVWSDGATVDKLSVSYVQPLLKGVGGINDQLKSDLSIIKIDINNLKRSQNAEQFILSQLFKLVNLSFAQQQLVLTTQRLELSQQELTLVREKFSQSVVDQVDVFLQEDAYQRTLQKQLQAEQELDLLKEELSVLLKIPSKQIKSDFNLYTLYQSNLGNLQDYLRQNTTEMQISQLEHALLNRQLLSDKNNTQAQLNLELDASNGNDWSVGLGLSYPLGDTKAKSALEKTQIELSKAKENAKELLINLTIKASVLDKKLMHLTRLLDTYQARIKIAKSRALAEKKRYELGNSPISFVISAQNNVHDVNLSYAQAAANYQKSVLEFKAAVDQLL
jgi:outer membrane protein TolC